MIRHIEHHEIEREKWDSRIQSTKAGFPYPLSWYLDIVSPGWEALVAGDYDMLMPLTWRKKYGIYYVFQPYFTQQLGVFSGGTAQIETAPFLDAIPSRFKYAEINLNQQNLFSGNAWQVTKSRNFELMLDAAYEDLEKNYSENTRRNIKKATAAGLEVCASNETDELHAIIELFRQDKGIHYQRLGDDYFDLLKRIAAAANVQIYSCYDDQNELIAGAVFLCSPQRIIFIFSGNSDSGRKSGAMHLLIDRCVNDFAGSGIILDFEGSNLPGLGRFYKSFGSKECVYLRLKRNNLPGLLRYLKR